MSAIARAAGVRLATALLIAIAGCRSSSHPRASSHSESPLATATTNAPPPPTNAAILRVIERSLPAIPIERAQPAAPRRARPSGSEFAATDPALDAQLARGERVEHAHGPFVVGIPSAEAASLVPYLDELLDRAVTYYTARYAVAAPTTIRIDLYPSTEMLRARVGGRLPYDVDGAYANGSIIALSPRGGGGNWGETMWHELAHAFQALRARGPIPRWLAEGLAELDARRERPEWTREPSADLGLVFARYDGGFLETVSRSIEAPTTNREQGDAYWLAMELVAFMEEDIGASCVIRLLDSTPPTESNDDSPCPELEATAERFYASGASSLRAASARHVPPLAYGEAYRGELGHPAPGVHGRAAADALVAGRWDDAKREAELAILESPTAALPIYVQARVALHERDLAAVACLERLARERDYYEALVALGEVALLRGDFDTAWGYSGRARDLDPVSPAAWDLNLRIADGIDAIDRVAARRHLVDVDERAADLGLALVRDAATRNDWRMVRAYGERLIYATPDRAELHELLAHAYEDAHDAVHAARERSVLAALRESPTSAPGPSP